MSCPRCKQSSQQIKAGFNVSGSQRYRCKGCRRNYTPEPKLNGYPEKKKVEAIRLFLEGNSFRGIARILRINYQTVANWVNLHAETLPEAPMPEVPEVGELDEMFTFIEHKKTDTTF